MNYARPHHRRKALAMEWKKVNRPPSPEFKQFQKDSKWFRDNFSDLKAHYPDQCVAVYHGKVVGASPDSIALVDELSDKGLPVGHIYFHYIHGDNAYPQVLGSSLHWPALKQD